MKILISILLIFSTFPGIAGTKPDQKIKIVFRFDDYRLRSDIVQDSIIYVFKKNRIPICLGIIPFDFDGLIYNQLNQEQLKDFKERISRNEVEIALHGFNHNDNKLIMKTFMKSSGPSEFVNLKYSDQFKKIQRGKTVLDSLLNTNINIFIPPFNSYDGTTLKVLDSLKFKVISASIEGSSRSGKISYIPFSLSDLTELTKVIESSRYDNLTIIAILHPYSFIGEFPSEHAKPIYINKLDSLLSWIKAQNYIVATDFSALNSSEVFDDKRFILNSTNRNMVIKILSKFEIYRYGVYNTTDYVRNHRVIFVVLNILFHLLVFSCFYFPTRILLKRIKSFKTLKFILMTVIVALLIGILHKGINSHGFIIYIMLMVTISLGFIAGFIKGNQMPMNSEV
jgi:hypothetical protein